MTQQDLVQHVLAHEEDPLSYRRTSYEKSIVDDDGVNRGELVVDSSPVALALITAARRTAESYPAA